MNIWVEIFLALALVLGIGFLWGFLQQLFGIEEKEKKDEVGFKKGVDFTGIAVVFLCHDGQGNYVTYKRSQNSRDEKGNWDIGSGGVEFNERVEDALRRESREEFSTDVVHAEFMGYRDVHRTLPDGRPTHWIALDYKVEVVREKVAIGEPDSIDEIRWWRTIDEIPTPRHSQLAFYLEKYKDTL